MADLGHFFAQSPSPSIFPMGNRSQGAQVRQQILWRDAPGYEAARRATVWNARLPERYPDVIVRARDVYDVVAAIQMAKREDLRVGVRSGGHSWSGNHVRDGGLLLDLSAMDEVTLDKEAMRATVGPGIAGHELAGLLSKHGLFFPVGHCKGVCLGGYLLQGGFGWNSRVLGPACMSVVGLDVVTADGQVVHASPEENADLYWAARGSGPGFFGVVTRFHLRVYQKPRVTGFALQIFSTEHLEEVFRWMHTIGPEVPAEVEMQTLMCRNREGKPQIQLFSPVFAEGLRPALGALSFMNRSALRSQASLHIPFIPATVPMMIRGVMRHYPEHHRYAVDNMWTHAPIEELLPALHRIAATLPPAPAHMLWLNWSPPQQRPDMAFSMEDKTYISLYSVWKHAQDDTRYATWAEDNLRPLQHLASGCQLADENLGRRPARFVADQNLARLDRIRAERDPQGRFHSWMGRP